MNPLFHTGFSISDSLKSVRKSVLIYETIIIDVHHGTAMMDTIFRLREKYNLHMKVERYLLDDEIPDSDKKYIKE